MSKSNCYRYSMDLPEAANTVCRAFADAGEEIYLVGGCLRDTVYGINVKDWDMATPCKPERVKEVLSTYKDRKNQYGIHHFPKGEAFGVISAMPWCGSHETAKGRRAVEIEIATFRKDIGEGRRPDGVEFCDMEEDAKRRDLTINALYYNPRTQRIHDFVGGWGDLNSRIVRCVGNPMDRFREDPLRVLRFVRFCCRFSLHGNMYTKAADSDHQKAVSVYAKMGLTGVSPERIREEFEKGISQSKATTYLKALQEAELLKKIVFPGCEVNIEVVNSHTIEAVLSSILYKTGSEKIVKLLNKLTYSTNVCKLVYFYIRFVEEFTRDKMKKDPSIPYRLKKYEISRNIRENVCLNLQKWAGTMSLDRRLVDVYHTWSLSTSVSEVPGTAGLEGRAIGERMQEYDTSNFWELAAANGYHL